MQRVFITLSLTCALLCATPGSYAASKPVSKQQAATIAKSRFQGRVIAVVEGKQDDTLVYRVKVLDKQGGMHTVVIDHQTGHVISAH